MGRNTRLVVGIVLVAVGLALLISYSATRDLETTTETFPGVTAVEFDIDNGGVLVEGREGDETTVEMSATTGLLGGEAALEQDGATLQIEHECPLIIGWGCRASFVVWVPEATSVTGSFSNGQVAIESIAGPVDVTTSNGAVTLDHVTSDVEAHTSNGAVIGTSLTSELVDVSTSNGMVDLEFDTAPDSVQATTSNGRLQVVLPSDAPPYALEASTSNGEVNADIRTDPSAPASIALETSNGDIVVFYGD